MSVGPFVKMKNNASSSKRMRYKQNSKQVPRNDLVTILIQQ
jgi:hypothetical protein